MRCLACDNLLTPKESVTRGILSGDFLDLCNSCIRAAGIASTSVDPSDSPLVEEKLVTVPFVEEDEEEEVFEE